MSVRLPLDLFAEVQTSSGTRFPWDSNQEPGSRPRGFLIRSKIGEGFSDAGAQFARQVDQDFPDHQLVNDVVISGADGTIAYEGRISAMPRDLSDTHSIAVTLTGWMAHAKDKRFSEIIVDRAGSWGGISTSRKADLLASNLSPVDAENGIDPTSNDNAVITHVDGSWVSPYKPISEAWYDAGPGNTIAQLYYSWARESAALSSADTNWTWIAGISDDDRATTYTATSNLRAAGPAVLQSFTGTGRFAFLQQAYGATPGGADGARFGIDWTKLAAYGDHGLTLHTGEPGEPPGVYASDVLRHLVARYCPHLNARGVQDDTYVIQHLAFRDRTFPYDAFLELNKFHLRHLGVWENKTLTWRPYDLKTADWEVTTNTPGVSFSPQGQSIDTFFNGITVTYEDLLTGIVNTLTPDDYPDLRDTAVGNQWNAWGIDHWDEITLSTPTLLASALQMGRARLAETNRVKSPGTLVVTGYVPDAAGNEQPGWKARAGQTIAVTSFPADYPRLIHEATWDDESKTLTLALDAPPSTLDAYQDRLANALQARGLA